MNQGPGFQALLSCLSGVIFTTLHLYKRRIKEGIKKCQKKPGGHIPALSLRKTFRTPGLINAPLKRCNFAADVLLEEIWDHEWPVWILITGAKSSAGVNHPYFPGISEPIMILYPWSTIKDCLCIASNTASIFLLSGSYYHCQLIWQNIYNLQIHSKIIQLLNSIRYLQKTMQDTYKLYTISKHNYIMSLLLWFPCHFKPHLQ